jgi:ferredoxin
MAGFMEEVKKRLKKQAISVYVPGNNPYKEYHVIPLHPKASSTCHQCGLCARRCPVQAIPLDNPQEIMKGQCISCMRCVHICPQQARKCSSIKIKMASQKLQKQCMVKKENEFF